jgi:hypothetical protein
VRLSAELPSVHSTSCHKPQSWAVLNSADTKHTAAGGAAG